MIPARSLTLSQVGRRVASIRRIWYEYRGTVRRSAGPLEFGFRDAGYLLLDAGPDGYSLMATDEPWLDPFTEPLSDENTNFVERSGKWTAFDVAGEMPYTQLVGQEIKSVEFIQENEDTLVGAVLIFETVAVSAVVGADELLVEFRDPT